MCILDVDANFNNDEESFYLNHSNIQIFGIISWKHSKVVSIKII